MVSELDKTSMEETLRVMNRGADDLKLSGGVSYGDSFSINDLDARLIDTLGNKKKIIEAGAKQGLKTGEEFTIGALKFKIVIAENNILTGFNGAIIKDITDGDLVNGKTILWADGSKGFNNLFTSPNIAKTLLELGNDWAINDLLGIGSSSIFPQLQNLKDFATSYMATEGKIDVGIGHSMMGVGMSALAFTKGFEKIQFRSYSGCLSYDLLHEIETNAEWGLNKLNGANLKSFTNANEPLTKIYEPVMKENKIYMLENVEAKGFAAHGADTYCSKDPNSSEMQYREIISFDKTEYPLWTSAPRFSFAESQIGNGFELSINIKLGSKHTAANVASETAKIFQGNVDCSLKVNDNDTNYDVYNKQEVIFKLDCNNDDLDNYNDWLKESSSDDGTVFLDLSNSQNQIKVPPSFVKSTDISDMYEGASSELKGEYNNPDIRLPEGADLHLPSHSDSETKIKYEYTTRPQMLSKVELAYIALCNMDALKIGTNIEWRLNNMNGLYFVP